MNLKRQQACRFLKQGKLLAYPTEAVYGLGCLANDGEALRTLRRVKRRASYKGFIVLFASLTQFRTCYPQIILTEQQLKNISAKQKHPTTWVIPISHQLGVHKKLLLGNNHSLAIRVSDHPTVKAICERVGPIVSTSANISGALPANNMLKLRKTFGRKIDFYLNEPLGNAKAPSQIIDLQSGEILRRA